MQTKQLSLSHVGICVSDLDHSKAFYRDVLGFEEFFQGPYKGKSVSSLVAIKDASFRSTLLTMNNSMVELIAYDVPKLGNDLPHNQAGVPHIAFACEDIDQLYSHLISSGVTPNSEPQTMTEYDVVDPTLRGSKFMIFRDPDGLQIEAFQLGFDPNESMPEEK